MQWLIDAFLLGAIIAQINVVLVLIIVGFRRSAAGDINHEVRIVVIVSVVFAKLCAVLVKIGHFKGFGDLTVGLPLACFNHHVVFG